MALPGGACHQLMKRLQQPLAEGRSGTGGIHPGGEGTDLRGNNGVTEGIYSQRVIDSEELRGERGIRDNHEE